ncbi:MAG: tyrosine-type recombinase/integrase [Clostridia bacterium]|nr:tyrosine-type recombinase/integrase [Clostridia bacterium]
MKKMTDDLLRSFKSYLINEEKAEATIEKYMHDVIAFRAWAKNAEVTKQLVLQYKQELVSKYAPTSTNAAISSLNSFFVFAGWHECKVKTLKFQKNMFARKETELTRYEYEKLLMAAKAKKNKRLYFMIQTICGLGLRVSELKHITVEAIVNGEAVIDCKGKFRVIILTNQLCSMLKKYIKANRITSGSVFVTKNGNPIDRSNIWSEMKKLCESAGVEKRKVFPHNLRHLFARTFYAIQKDIVRLADILGHSSINTTRIYTMESGEEHRKLLRKLGLLRC